VKKPQLFSLSISHYTKSQSSNYCLPTDKYFRQLAVQQVPDLVSGLFLDINEAVDKLGSVLNNATNSLGCPNLNNISKSKLNNYPGFTKE